MREIKRKIIQCTVYLFIFVGTAALVKPMCMGWFYQPEVPEVLKGLNEKKKGIA